MGTIKDFAKSYESPKNLNIADLAECSIEFQLKLKNAVNQETGEEYSYNYVEVNGNEYRVPTSVITQLKVLIEARPDVVKFKVAKSGQGLATKYTVIGL